MASRSRIDWRGMRPAASRRSAARVPSTTSAQGLARGSPSSVRSRARGKSVRSGEKAAGVEMALGVDRGCRGGPPRRRPGWPRDRLREEGAGELPKAKVSIGRLSVLYGPRSRKRGRARPR